MFCFELGDLDDEDLLGERGEDHGEGLNSYSDEDSDWRKTRNKICAKILSVCFWGNRINKILKIQLFALIVSSIYLYFVISNLTLITLKIMHKDEVISLKSNNIFEK